MLSEEQIRASRVVVIKERITGQGSTEQEAKDQAWALFEDQFGRLPEGIKIHTKEALITDTEQKIYQWLICVSVILEEHEDD